jgi:hypothetical protein
MKLWTIQEKSVFEKLKCDGIHRATLFKLFQNATQKTDYQILKDVLKVASYEWMSNKMREAKVSLEDGYYPVWTWAYLNRDILTNINPDSVLMELDLPNEETVLLSSFEGWEYVLNYLYFGTEEKTDFFIEKCTKKNQNFFDNKPLQDEKLHMELVNSWDKIFNFTETNDILNLISQVQGCIGSIKKEWIKNVIDLESGETIFSQN